MTESADGLPLPRGPCWTAAGALAVLRTEALSNNGATFLATHTAMEGFTVRGLASAGVRERTEKGLLDALSAPECRHAFAVVQGEPGSGKSHLIRWLAEMWPAGRDIPVLLRRAEASLEGSLRGLREAIPPQYREVVGEIELRQVKSVKGRIADFVSNLGNSLDPDYFDQAPPDRDFCVNFAPGDILRIDDVRTGWQAPARLVNLMGGAGGDGAVGARNSESASFTVHEVADLAAYAGKVAKISSRAARLLNAIDRELDFIERSKRDDVPAERLLTTHRGGAQHAARLTDSLNARRNHAIQSSLGITASKLKGIFLDLRRALKRDDKRLVILLEDITAWEGVDDSLIDVLIDDATTTKGDLCDQVSVVGVTPYYFDQMKANYQQRVTHDIGLGDGGEGFQDVANLREPRMRTRFVATYLRAIRAGEGEIEAWRAGKAADAFLPVPNRCERCPFDARTRCHQAFGSWEGTGLYPFSETAIENFYSALKRQDQGMTWRTPRGIIQGVLAPTLTRPEALSTASYPTREVEIHAGIDRDQTYVTGLAHAKLESSISDPMDRDRARRLIAFWGDREDARTRRTADGDLSYAEVPRSIFETFEIPWLGSGTVDVETVGDETASDPVLEDADQRNTLEESEGFDVDRAAAPETDPRPEPPGEDRPRTITKRAPPSDGIRSDESRLRRPDRPRPVSQKDVNDFLVEIRTFQTEGVIKTPSKWNEFARELLRRVDVQRLDIDEIYFKTLFKEDQIKVRGTSKVDRGSYFELPDEAWFIEGLEAHARLRNAEHFNSVPVREQEVIRRRVARCLRRMEGLARAHVERMTPRTPDGALWARIATATQVLAVRAWLRGDVKPTAEPVTQWRTILNGEGQVATDPRSRVDSWDAILRKTNASHGAIRGHLADAVRLAQGEGKSYGLADASVPVGAIVSLIREFRLSERPSDLKDLRKDPIYEQVWDAAATSSERLIRLPNDEFERLKTRAERIEERRRDNGIVDHLNRVAAVVEKAEAGLPPASKQISAVNWLRSKDELVLAPDAAARIEAVENCLAPLVATPKPETRLQVLELVATQPAADVELVYQVMTDAEKVVETMKTAIADFVGKARPGALTLEEIRDRGANLSAQAKAAAQIWNGDA